MEPTIHQHVRASMRDAVFTNLTVGMAEAYFAAFMLAMGLSEVMAGAGKILPMFLGVCLQLFAIRGRLRTISLKKRAWGFVALQTLSLPLLAGVAFFQVDSTPLILLLLTLYWAAGLSAIAPWNRLMGETIPQRFHVRFFAERNAWAQGAILLGLLVSGAVLAWGEGQLMNRRELLAVIFLACAVCKLFSIRELLRHRDSPLQETIELRVRLRDFLQRLGLSSYGPLVCFLFIWYAVVEIAGVYFDPYMLGQLKWDPARYTSIIAVSFVGRIVVLSWLKHHLRPQQIPKALWLGCAVVTLTPLSWTLSTTYLWIFFVELCCGAGWALIELTTALIFLEKIPHQQRTSLMAYINFTNTIGRMIGVLVGGWLLAASSPHEGAYQQMFQLSSLLRAAALLGFSYWGWQKLRGKKG